MGSLFLLLMLMLLLIMMITWIIVCFMGDQFIRDNGEQSVKWTRTVRRNEKLIKIDLINMHFCCFTLFFLHIIIYLYIFYVW